jgi:hypothetical protein
MDLLCDFAHVESHFNPLGDSGSVSASYVHGLRETYHRHKNHFGLTLLGDEAQVDAHFCLFGDSANLDAR